MLRRIIRRAVRYAYLLGTEQLVLPSLADVAIDVMANAYPDVASQRDFIIGVFGQGGRALPPDAAQRPVDPRARARSTQPAALSGLDRVPAPRHLRLPARAHPGDRLGARGHGRHRRLRGRDERATERAKAAPAAVREAANVDAYRAHHRGARHHGRSTATSPTRRRREVLAVRRRPGDTATTTWSRSSSTRPRSTPRAVARWVTPGSSPPSPAPPT